MDFVETDEHRDLRAAVGRIAAPFGGDYYVDHARRGEECTELWHALGDAGFVGVSVPEEYGGGGGGLVELALVCEETAAAGAPMLLLLVTHAISAAVIAEYGTEEQRKEWLPGLASGREKVVFAITEPGAGSNTHQLATTARREGEEWVVRGEKYYISGVDEAEALLLVARTGTDPRGNAQLSLFLVPTDAEGLQKVPLPVDVMLPEKQFTLRFDEVRLPATALVGDEGQGFRQVFHGLNPERITGAALCVGIARYALARAARYANEREVWGRPIGSHQGVAHPLAKARVETELAALMTRKAAWLHDRGLPAGEESNMAKYAAAEAALAAVDAAMQTHGGNGVASEFGLLPYWGLARLLRIAPVNREMILNFVAQHGLGLPRSY
ncbi:acyl-CoA dehydrogenase family protein [Actinomycetospora sp. TBRC 11914]|uniref:acyl-CoA dehydrogenase family protein n=1 Tax=Actinomycetospora sp. TBRC 11914 TaxID=2729387 RepID=UPI00145ED6C7|nr:acyl-CoA dehydrogenase family protein [Actinomycetospora sp. TBRC 11914]NMO93187.1 acyl-CoA/acyl-ACP dehydrogenase [Actinomycetospora sp. TBRC 11914]